MKMSVEEEVELRDLVTHTLELNGCLPKIRAQLRASLFLALDEDSKINQQQPLLNKKIKSHLEAPEGQLMFCLVREFLEYFDLDFTASVYDSESYVGSFYKYEGRQKIIDDLGLKPPDEPVAGPLLLHVVKIAQMKSKTLKMNLVNSEKESNGCSVPSEQINGHTDNNEENPLHATFVKEPENDDTFNGTSSIEDETANGDVSKKEDEVLTSPDPDTSPESKSRSKSLRKLDLPPLQLNKSRDLLPSLYKKANKEYDFEIKEDYEEDFMSSSDLEFSSKIDSPKPLFDELQQCERISKNVNRLSGNKLVNSNSTDIDTNLSVDNSDT